MERQQLPPGFRFHPTDEELVLQYLRRKALARPLPAAVIPVVHAAVLPDPWDLPGASQREAAYFFSQRHAPARGAGARRQRAAQAPISSTPGIPAKLERHMEANDVPFSSGFSSLEATCSSPPPHVSQAPISFEISTLLKFSFHQCCRAISVGLA